MKKILFAMTLIIIMTISTSASAEIAEGTYMKSSESCGQGFQSVQKDDDTNHCCPEHLFWYAKYFTHNAYGEGKRWDFGVKCFNNAYGAIYFCKEKNTEYEKENMSLKCLPRVKNVK